MARITNLLISVTFFLARTFAAIASDSNNSSPEITTSANASLNAVAVCYRKLIDRRRADHSQCLGAAQQLPEGVVPGSFHEQGADDAFRLPKVVRYKTCSVIVSLESLDGEPDQSTWHRIMNGAFEVAEVCRTPKIYPFTTGGFVFVGDRGAIKISLEKSSVVPLSAGNATTGTAIS